MRQQLVALRRVRDRIDREFDRPLSVEALAATEHMSAGHLSRQFKAAFGESPYSFLMTRRIERAMALIRRGDLTITEICFTVGFSSLGTFSTRFSELVGVSPRPTVTASSPESTACRRFWSRTRCDRSGIEKSHPPQQSTIADMNISINASFLPHVDAEESLAFYTEVLGFELRLDVGSGRMRWLTVGPVDQPDTSIVLTPAITDPTISETEREVIESLMTKGSYAGIVLASADVDAVFAEVEAEGAEIVQEPMDQPYGLRDCALRDPAGNMIRIQQRS
jgi:AraC-like DNA-binding protein/catechol 2,3-dioxygenase-like lactoylglutathione lyase family enzyme